MISTEMRTMIQINGEIQTSFGTRISRSNYNQIANVENISKNQNDERETRRAIQTQ